MALVNPNIAMSFRQPEFRPRNALAEYAQVQQIVGGQRQTEIADMQLEALRRKDRAISQIQAAAAKNGGPTDRREIARAYVQSGVPEFMQFGLTLEKDLDELDAFARIMGGGARPATGGAAATAPTSAAGALTGAAPVAAAPAAAEPPPYTTGPQGVMTYPAGHFGVTSKRGGPAEIRMQDPNAVAAQQSAVDAEIERQRSASTPADVMQRAASYANARGEMYPTDNDIAAARRELNIPAPANALAPAPVAAANALAPAAQPATPPENVNQLAAAGGAAAAAAAPSADPVAALRTKRDQLIALGTPRALQAAKSLDADIALMSKRITASPGSVVYDASGNVVATAPAAPVTPRVEIIGVAKGTDTPVYVDKNTDAQFKIGVDASGKQVRVPYTGAVNRSTSSVTVTGGKQESAFETGLGKGQSERILTNQVVAQEAASIIDTVNTGRQIMQAGMITGAGAEFLVNLNQALKTVGIDSGYADAAANSQAFAANMANNVGRLIKQFGAGTGLSNADREYAEKMAGSKITLDAKAINRILDINERAARNVIARHNRDVKGIKTNIPLTVEEPPPRPAGAGADAAPPQAAINFLRANPTTRAEFDKKYGAGAAARALGGQ
jgi:hypothetical protein